LLLLGHKLPCEIVIVIIIIVIIIIIIYSEQFSGAQLCVQLVATVLWSRYSTAIKRPLCNDSQQTVMYS